LATVLCVLAEGDQAPEGGGRAALEALRQGRDGHLRAALVRVLPVHVQYAHRAAHLDVHHPVPAPPRCGQGERAARPGAGGALLPLLALLDGRRHPREQGPRKG